MQLKHRTARQEEAALEALTGLSAEEVRRGQATEGAAARRAEAIGRAFLCDRGFGDLLLVFAMSSAAEGA